MSSERVLCLVHGATDEKGTMSKRRYYWYVGFIDRLQIRRVFQKDFDQVGNLGWQVDKALQWEALCGMFG